MRAWPRGFLNSDGFPEKIVDSEATSLSSRMSMKTPLRVAVTGAAGQIGYSLLFRIASGSMFGPDQPVTRPRASPVSCLGSPVEGLLADPDEFARRHCLRARRRSQVTLNLQPYVCWRDGVWPTGSDEAVRVNEQSAGRHRSFPRCANPTYSPHRSRPPDQSSNPFSIVR